MQSLWAKEGWFFLHSAATPYLTGQIFVPDNRETQSSNAFSSNLAERLITAHYPKDISLLYFMNITAR